VEYQSPSFYAKRTIFRLDVDELKKMVTPKTKVIIVKQSAQTPQEAYLIRKSLKPFLIWRTGASVHSL